MSIASIGPIALGNTSGLSSTVGGASQASSPGAAFMDRLEAAVDQVNDQQIKSDEKIGEFVTGGDVPVHKLMMELSKADISMKLMTAVTAKAIQAYQEIARLQV